MTKTLYDEIVSATEDKEVDPRHANLKAHPGVWAAVGVIQTLMTAGVIFGWASLLPVLREEGADYTPQEFTTIFTGAAIGNYLSTLFFGFICDKWGPRTTGIVASILFGLGLYLCSCIHTYIALATGFFLLGFAGPGIQMPTLHLANLFTSSGDPDGPPKEGGSGGGALFMSAQAAAFDGGTAVFAILRLLFHATGFPATTFLRLYIIVPAWVLVTSIFVWPDDILEDERHPGETNKLEESYVGYGSPYLSSRRNTSSIRPGRGRPSPKSLVNAPLSTVLIHPAFWSLAIWVSIHILKLNFVVATINDQLEDHVEPEAAEKLIGIFGAMLPFGFVVLPIVATLLEKSAIWAFQWVNVVGVLYGGVLVFSPGSKILQSIVVFPAVASSRQFVYSTVFHQVGELFGFANYGVLLGLCNVLVSAVSAVQTPMVSWSEAVGSYKGSNMVLLVVTLPLFGLVFWANTSSTTTPEAKIYRNGENTPLNREPSEAGEPAKRNSYV